MNGVVQSGGTATMHVAGAIRPLSGAQVSLFDATSNTLLGNTTTDANGAFTIDTTVTSTSTLFYATATLDHGVMLMAILGQTLPGSITINELTTIAACYSAAQFLNDTTISGDALPLSIVAGMNANLVDVSDGASSAVMLASPNADETNALRSTRALANFLASCVRGVVDATELFYKLTTPPNGEAPANTIAAIANIARYPANHAGGIYVQSKLTELYQPSLEQQPDAWTLVVKVNDSGDDAHMFAGPGNLAFDAHGRVWIANNVVQGSGVSTPWSIVLNANGTPAPQSPFTGGGLLGPGYGVDIDSKGQVWFGDFGWGKDFPVGSVSVFDSNAQPLSPDPDGYVDGGVYRVQGTVVDANDNVWLASWGNGRVVVYPGGDASSAITFPADDQTIPDFAPFDVAFAKDGTAWVTNSNGKSSGIIQLELSDGRLKLLRETKIGKVLKGIVIDSTGKLWVSSGGNDHVYAFTAEGELIGAYQGGGTYGPWGIALDGNDNVWVGNFGPLEVGSVVHGRVTQLAGPNADQLLGTAISPQAGYTLPSAGSPVTLHNGEPLYGPNGPECYIPMMRTTGLKIDAAGNVWTCNNWKPSFDMDLFGDPMEGIAANPGGDGMLIWIGLAAPVPV